MKVYTQNKDMILQDNENENMLIIFDPDKSILHTLNESAAFIVKKLRKPKSFDMLVELLAQEYQISIEKSKKDVAAFIPILEKKNIIKSKVINA